MNASMAPPSTWANSAALTSYTYTTMIGSPFVARPRLRRLGRCRMVLTDLEAARYSPFTFPYGPAGGCDRIRWFFPTVLEPPMSLRFGSAAVIFGARSEVTAILSGE